MTKELNIDLVVTRALDVVSLRKLQAGLSTPLVVYNGVEEKISELVLPINLDDKYYHKIQSSIGIASLLNMQIRVIGFTSVQTNEFRYKEKLDDIKSMVQKENVTCTISFIKADNSEMVLPDVEIAQTVSLLFTFEEFNRFVLENKGSGEGFSSCITLMPVKKTK